MLHLRTSGPRREESVWEMESFPLVEDEVVGEHLVGISVHKSMDPDGMLRE